MKALVLALAATVVAVMLSGCVYDDGYYRDGYYRDRYYDHHSRCDYYGDCWRGGDDYYR